MIAAGEAFVVWEGRSGAAAPGMRAEAVVHVFTERSDGCWRRSVSRQEQRHWPVAAIRAAAAAAGLRIVELLGQRTGVVLEPELDEARHSKALYFATRAGEGGGEGMDLIRP